MSQKPIVTLLGNNYKTRFLCDTGACRTITRKDEGGSRLPLQHGKGMKVRSATRHIVTEPLSRPVSITDPKTNKSVLAVVAVSNLCPVNLLGRDLMEELGIGVIPTPLGMKACRMTRIISDSDEEMEEANQYVRERSCITGRVWT